MGDQYWKTQERRIRSLLEERGWDATRQPGSGALPSENLKGDVIATFGGTTLLVDHKSTKGEKSITIARGDVQKNSDQATAINATPAITFSYYHKHDLYAIVPLNVLLDLLESREQVLARLEEIIYAR